MANLQELQVEGMTCSNCAQGVSKNLKSMGLEKVNVNFSTGEVQFENVPKLKDEKINYAIQNLGYRVIIEGHDGSNQSTFTLEKKFILSLIFTIPLFFAMFIPWEFLHQPITQFILCLPPFILGSLHFGKSAYHSIKNGIANMDVLIFVGSSSAFIYSVAGSMLYYNSPEVGKYLFFETAATIITLVLLGNLLEHRSVKKTTSALKELGELQSETANKVLENGELQYVQISELKIGDRLQVNEGDSVPTDGKVSLGEAKVDESMISGESISILKKENDQVFGGTILKTGAVQMIVTQIGKGTVLSKIIDLVKQAQSEQPDIQRLGDKVSAIFVPVVLAIAAITFIVWYFVLGIAFSEALMNAIAVLVISCPCAMGLATPTAVMVGIGRAAKEGILMKGGQTVEQFSKIKHIIFDKTGTITNGQFRISAFDVKEEDREKVEQVIYSLEQFSSHPIAVSLKKEMKKRNAKTIPLINQKEIKGKGIEADDLEGNHYQFGSANWLEVPKGDSKQSDLYLKKNDDIIASILIDDDIRKNAKETILAFKSQDIKTHLLSGDKKDKVESLGLELSFDSIEFEASPEDKLKYLENLENQDLTAMIGDGINDAPVLSKASVGISMADASQIAIQSAKIILLKNNSLSTLTKAHSISKHTYLTIKQNLFWAFFYNVIAIPIAAMGFLSPMLAALSMAFSDVIVVGNALRLKFKKID
jgi:Cu+-exporting ATPase